MNLRSCVSKVKDTKGVIRSHKSKDRQYNDQREKGQKEDTQ